MKKLLKPTNIITFIILLFVLTTQGPIWIKNYKLSGQRNTTDTVYSFTKNAEINIDSGKYIILSWASWCAPCKVEMKRYQSSIESGEIDPQRLLALNFYESDKEINKFIKKNNYKFNFVKSPSLISSLSIQATPTVTFLENQIITRQSTGISIIGIFLAESFL